MKRIGIVGTRRKNGFGHYILVRDTFAGIYQPGDELVSGGCPHGGDRFAEEIAKRYQIPIKIYYAAWNRLGKSAGFIRNGDIAKDADILIAVVSDDRTGGTEDTIRKWIKTGRDESNLYLIT